MSEKLVLLVVLKNVRVSFEINQILRSWRYKINARVGVMQEKDVPEPKIVEQGMLQCTVCRKVFASREDYVSHALAIHQPSEPET
jgi:hypothetical protein